jgi:hypothetical protein
VSASVTRKLSNAVTVPTYAPTHSPVLRLRRAQPATKTLPLGALFNQLVMAGFLLIVLYLSAHCALASVDNTLRFSKLSHQKKTWATLHAEQLAKHSQLKAALNQSKSAKGLEALVRNKLEWVGEEEILIRLH